MSWRSDKSPPKGEIYLEFYPLGGQIKVTAIDAASGVEVVVFGPANTPRGDLERLAVAKLQRRLASRS